MTKTTAPPAKEDDMALTNEITIQADKVRCDCGYYDKSSDPRTLARIHNTGKHWGNYRIWDVIRATPVSQLTGKYD